jgi:hypothetical protein
VNILPSPYLTGVFDAFTAVREDAMVETNRGCPYGCTFCDWGSATLSKIRKFDLERVLEELEWLARHGFQRIGLCDANFGIFERDLTIARHVARLREEHGVPRTLAINYAKNNQSRLEPIVQTLSEASIFSFGVLSTQSMDAQTLSTIRRSNIKPERYDELAFAMRKAGLPLFAELMVLLPGQTLKSFKDGGSRQQPDERPRVSRGASHRPVGLTRQDQRRATRARHDPLHVVVHGARCVADGSLVGSLPTLREPRRASPRQPIRTQRDRRERSGVLRPSSARGGRATEPLARPVLDAGRGNAANVTGRRVANPNARRRRFSHVAAAHRP